MPTFDNFSLGNYNFRGPSGVKYASGTLVTPSQSKEFLNNIGNWVTAFAVEVHGLSFRPTKIIVRHNSPNTTLVGIVVYDRKTVGNAPSAGIANYNIISFPRAGQGSTVDMIRMHELTGTGWNTNYGAVINDDSFLMPFSSGNTTIEWIAIDEG